MSAKNDSKPKFGDYIYAVTKGSLSTVPVVGGVISELFSVVFPSPSEKRKDQNESVTEDETKIIKIEYGQLVTRILGDYGERIRVIVENGDLNDCSMTFDEKLELLEEGLRLMLTALNEIEQSSVFRSFNDSDRNEIKYYIGLTKERLDNIDNDSYYQFEEEADEDIKAILDFYNKSREFMYPSLNK